MLRIMSHSDNPKYQVCYFAHCIDLSNFTIEITYIYIYFVRFRNVTNNDDISSRRQFVSSILKEKRRKRKKKGNDQKDYLGVLNTLYQYFKTHLLNMT